MPEPSAQIFQFSGPDAPPGSEDQIALTYAALHADRLRHVAAWNKWLRWDNVRWRIDTTFETFDSIRPLVRAEAELASKDSTANAIASAKTVAAVERLIKSDRRLATTSDIWDADLMKLGTPGGTVDLSTGELRAASPNDFITKLAGATPTEPGEPHPTWSRFLDFVTSGDKAYEAFLQKVAGYCLTGRTTEHALFFLYGPGRNGKSVFVNVLSRLLGEYSETASMDTFTSTTTDRHPTDLAKLRSARLVIAQETDRGRSWSLARIKMLTGNDKVSARFMRQDFFEYVPQFKLFIVGNDRPGIDHLDEAIRTRLRVIPFERVVPPEQRDRELQTKLDLEMPAILRWAIEGCRQWTKEGLNSAPPVDQATNDYFEAEDLMAEWLRERCRVAKAAKEGSTRLYHDWKAWCAERGEYAGSHKVFAGDLRGRGFKPDRLSDGKSAFQGISLK